MTPFTDDRPTHLDLFSGIGGFSIAFESAGFNTIGFSEIEPTACRVLKRNWPHTPNLGDIRTIRGVRADVVTGGFPCQPFSQAGKRRGKDDDRFLWPEMLRVITESRAAAILGENVAGITGMELDGVLSSLESIGYSARAFDIPASAVCAPHIRRRVWIVAYSTQVRWPAAGVVPSSQLDAARGYSSSGEIQDVSGQKQGGGLDPTATPIRIGRAFWDFVRCQSGRTDDGVSVELDRIGALGNSIVPAVANIFARILYQQIRQLKISSAVEA